MRIAQTTTSFVSRSAAMLAALVLLPVAPCLGQEKAPPKLTYADHARPILMQRCSSCHNSDRSEGDLDITNYRSLISGGGSGESISPGSADESYLFRLVTHQESPKMPPSGTKIPDPQIEMLRKWIDGGALENSGSVAKKRKPRVDYGTITAGDKRPNVIPMPSRMPLNPALVTKRKSTVRAIAANPWAPVIAVSSPKQVLLYRTNDFALHGVIPFPEGQPESLRFSRNGQLLLIAGGRGADSGTAVLWDAINGRRVTAVGDAPDSILAADIHGSQNRIAWGGPGKVVYVCNLAGEIEYEISKHTDWITALQFSPDGKFLVTADRNGGVFLWEADSGNEVATLKGHQKSVTAIDWRIDSKLALTASEDGTVRIWEPTNGKQIRSINACGKGVTDATFTRDGLIVTGGRDHLVRVWEQNGKQRRATDKMKEQVTSVAWCSETNRIIAGDWAGNLKVWDEAKPKPVAWLRVNPPSIESRVNQLSQELAAAQTVFAPLEEQTQNLVSRIGELGASNQAEISIKTASQKKLASFKIAIEGLDKQLKSSAGQQQERKKELALKRNALPAVATALVKAKVAASSLPRDADLASMVKTLEAKQNELKQRVGVLTKQLKQDNAKRSDVLANLKSNRDSKNRVVKETQQLSLKIAANEKMIGQLSSQVAQRKPALDKARGEVTRLKNRISFWQKEQGFSRQYAALQKQLNEARNANEPLRQAVDTAREKLANANGKVEEIEKQILELKKQNP